MHISSRTTRPVWIFNVTLTIGILIVIREGKGESGWAGADVLQIFAMLFKKDVVIFTAAANNKNIILLIC